MVSLACVFFLSILCFPPIIIIIMHWPRSRFLQFIRKQTTESLQETTPTTRLTPHHRHMWPHHRRTMTVNVTLHNRDVTKNRRDSTPLQKLLPESKWLYSNFLTEKSSTLVVQRMESTKLKPCVIFDYPHLI